MANRRRVAVVTIFFLLGSFLLLFTGHYPFTSEDAPPPAPTRQQTTYFPQTSQELEVHFISGPEKGPTVLVFGGIHGDEAAGYLTAERFTRLEISRGNLIVVPRLNAVAIARGKRRGLGGDMNRLFDLSEEMARINPDARVVALAKSLISQADYVLNLHQAYDFYSPRWISRQRNPRKWGQSNVIDAPIYHLPNGDKLEPGRFAHAVSMRSNKRIKNKNYHFLVNDTNTAGPTSRHGEQRRSLTYYALTKQHKVALGIEATKNCSLIEAIGFLTIAVNSVMEEAGIRSPNLPGEDGRLIRRELKKKDGQGSATRAMSRRFINEYALARPRY